MKHFQFQESQSQQPMIVFIVILFSVYFNNSSSFPFLISLESDPSWLISLRHLYFFQIGCSREVCGGSIVTTTVVGAEPRKPAEVLEQAKDFMEQYFTSMKR